MTRRRTAVTGARVPSRCSLAAGRLQRPGCRDVATARTSPRRARRDRGTGDRGCAAPSTPTATTSPSPTASAAAGSVRFSALGDINSTDASDAVLRSIAARHDDFTLALGDLSYGDDGAEGAWCRFVTQRVGADHPFELVSGNHESNGENGDIDRFARCLPNRLPGLVGTYGRQWYVDQPADPPAGAGRDDLAGARLRARLRGPTPRAHPTTTGCGRRSPGRVRPASPGSSSACTSPACRSATTSATPVPTSSTCMLDTGVDLVLTGHEHLYQRTRAAGAGRRLPDDPARPATTRSASRPGAAPPSSRSARAAPRCATCTVRTPSVATSLR